MVLKGNTPLYLANNIFKVEAGGKLKEGETYSVGGFESTVTFIKSRSNRAGQEVKLIFDQVRGFDNVLSNLAYLKDNKILKGAGIGLYLEEMPDVKFRLSNFKEKIKANSDFRKEFRRSVIKNYRTFIPKLEEDEDNNEEETVETATEKKKTSKRGRKPSSK